MSEAVLADAQLTLAKILKPFTNFEATYQGQDSSVPIAFFAPDDKGNRDPRDPDAGRAGFDPNLLRYVDVPLGSRILLWIPAAIVAVTDNIAQTNYLYTVYWRMRTPTDYRNRRTPFHLTRQFPGQIDNTAVPPERRVLIPAATRSVIINQTEAAGSNTQVQNLRREAIQILTTLSGLQPYSQLPLLPGGVQGAHQQGVFDPATFSIAFRENAFKALFVPVWFDCEGDQMLVCAEREALSPWDFAAGGTDAPFSNIYGTNVAGPTHPPFEDLGIYMFTGTAP